MQNDKSVEWLFFHGWGFDPSFWRGFESELPRNGLFRHENRGYWGETETVCQFEQIHALKIIVTHSFGLHRVKSDLLEKADYLVVVGGFLSFPMKDRTVLDRMRDRMLAEPEAALSDFLENCFFPQPVTWKGMGGFVKERLAEDLEQLKTSERFPYEFQKLRKVLILHGTADRIVPFKEAQSLHACLPQSLLIPFEGAGHALLATHARRCAAEMKRCLL